jgi:hypothetical protein
MATLNDVIEKARVDRGFFNDLLDDPNEALQKAKMHLSSEDLATLVNIRKQLLEYCVSDLLILLGKVGPMFYGSGGIGGGVPWPPSASPL